MNKAEILRYAPKGFLLYSPIMGELSFDKVQDNKIYTQNGCDEYVFTSEGKYVFNPEGKYYSSGECVLFPDKHKVWDALKLFKRGDYVAFETGTTVKIVDIMPYYYIAENKDGSKCQLHGDNYRFASPDEIRNFEQYCMPNFKPFDRVLVRACKESIWYASFISAVNNDSVYLVSSAILRKYVIPYEGNEDLAGTTNDCDDKYKWWEK